jgi:predicted MPP superfamily phosphohydrolase
MRLLGFFAVWFATIGVGSVYVGSRIIRNATPIKRQRMLGWGVIIIVLVLQQVPLVLWMTGHEAVWIDSWFWPGYITLGFFSFVFTLTFLRDIILLITTLPSRVATILLKLRARNSPPTEQCVPAPDRRQFLVHTTNMGIVGVSGVIAGYGVYESHSAPHVEEITLPFPNLPGAFEGFRIVQFSDLHAGPTIKRRFVERVVEEVNALRPDLIAFTGDMVDGSVSHLREEVAPLRELSAPYGKFFVTGNHEYYSGAEQWIEEADKIGFNVLMNEHKVISRSDGSIVLAGVTDFAAGSFIKTHVSDPAAAIAQAPSSIPRILLAHQPKSIFGAEKAGYDVQISGHTHGGQFFPWDNFARLNQPYLKGLHKHGKTVIYVNRGVGYWGPPLRLGVPPEITVFTLTRLVAQA